MNKYIAVIVSLLLTACSSAGEFFQDEDSGRTPMSLSFGITGTGNSVMSRAAVSSFGSSDEIGVCLRTDASTATYDGSAYENMEYNASTGSKVSGDVPLLSANTGNIYAYYPYSSSIDITAIPMSDAQTDYMYGSAATTSDAAFSAVTCDDHNASPTVYMHHAKALLHFTITRGTDYTGTGLVSTIRVSGAKITGTGKLNITNGTVTPDAKADVMVYNEQTIPSGSGSITQDLLVISMTTSTQDVTAYFVIDGKTYTISLTGATIKNQYQTNVNLTMNDTGLTLNSVGISTWNELATITKDFELSSDHDYVEIGGLKWATMNLGATSVADDAATAYGDYYAWGATETWYSSLSWSGTTPTFKWEDGYTNRYIESNAPYYNSSDYTKYNDTDGLTTLEMTDDAARKAWGGKWRIPTLADFESLFSACDVDLTQTSKTISYTGEIEASKNITAKGVYRINTSSGAITIDGVTYSVKGTLFVADASDTSKRIFLPAGGYIEEVTWNLGPREGREYGRYWTSTLDSSYVSCSYLLYLTYTHIVSTNSEDISAERYYGLSIRPVSE